MRYVGKITKIDEPKPCRNWKGNYRRIYVKAFDGHGKMFWCLGDIVDTLNNYRFWEDKLEVGYVLGNLGLRDGKFIDTDVQPEFIGSQLSLGELEVYSKQLSLL